MVLPERAEIFTNHGNIHPVERILLCGIAYLLAVNLLGLFLLPFLPRRDGSVDAMALRDPGHPAFIGMAWIQLVAALLVAVVFTRRLDRQPFIAVGLWFHRGWRREAAVGLLLGALLIGLIFGGLLAFGLAIPARAAAAPGWNLAVGALALLPLALVEEILFRGYLLRNLTQAFGARRSLFLMAALFALGHFFNPAHTPLSLFNIGLAGILMGYPYLRSGSLWLPFGLHFAWNFTQGPLLGMPVSGLGFPGLLQTLLLQPTWASGGAFGPEGSILTTGVVLAGLGYLIWRYRRVPPVVFGTRG